MSRRLAHVFRAQRTRRTRGRPAQPLLRGRVPPNPPAHPAFSLILRISKNLLRTGSAPISDLAAATIAAIGGLIIGLVFGATAQRTNFCAMGGITDRVLMGDGRRLRAWVLATAVALIGSQFLAFGGYVDLGQSIYLTTNFGWLGAILGGLVFGFGMVFTGGCPSRTLVRLGGGNLKSLVVTLVLAVVAYMTLRGLFAPMRISFEQATNVDLTQYGLASQHMGEIAAGTLGVGEGVARVVTAIIVALVLLWFCFKDGAFRTSPRDMVSGVVVGLTAVAGWVVTGIIAFDDFEPVPLASVTLVAPVADALQFLMTYTGATINFGIAVVGGIIAGSFVAAAISREFRVEGFTDRDDFARHIVGAAFMGVGGVFALGCTIGQGVTGMSTLAFGSLVAWLSIMAGGYLGVKYLEEGSFGGVIRAAFARG